MSANCPARGSRTSFSYIDTGADGNLPATIADGDFQELPRSGGNVNVANEYFTSNNINSNRQKSAPTAGVQTVAGELQADYGHGNFDYLFESLFRSSFTGNSIKIADQIKTFALQVSHKDKDDHFVHKGLRVNTFSCEINTTGVVTSTFGLMGIETETPAAALDNAPTDAPSDESFIHIGGTFKEGGVTSAVITGLSFTIDNQISNDWALGAETPVCVSASDLVVQGSFDVFFTNLNLYQKFVDSTTTSLEATIKDANSKQHTWKFPAIKLLGHDIPINDGGSITVSIPFEAFFDSASGTTVELVRSA